MLNIVSLPKIEFPKGFIWGSATAAHQIEGDDISSENWHKEIERNYEHHSGKACNSYALYKEDIELLKNLGHQAYRLSIPWSRIEPVEGDFRQEEVNHYINLLALLKKTGIKTVVSLRHGSIPNWYGKIGEFNNRDNLKYFERYVKYIVPKITDLVDFWTVLNEFNIAGGNGVIAAPYRTNSLIAHAKVYHIIKQYSNAPVSSAHALQYCHPENPYDHFDQQFAELNDWMVNEFFFHAVRTGEIVFPYQDMVYVPELKDAMDYWAINYYNRRMISSRKQRIDGRWYSATHLKMIDKDFYLEEFFPEGLANGLLRIKDKPVYITENGNCCDDDRWRIVKLAQDLTAVSDAIKNGVDVKGYLHWSLLDNYEWSSFIPKFGLVEVNLETFERTPKPSSQLYKEIIEKNSFDGEILQKYLPEMPVFKLYN